MRGANSIVSDDPTLGPASKLHPRTGEADQPTVMDGRAITSLTTMAGWSFGMGTTQLGAELGNASSARQTVPL